MSGDREDVSERLKKSFYCKVCQVACLNGDGLRSHCREEEHEKMEDAYYGKKYGKPYCSLQDYISCTLRKEPLIGLQYIVQLYPEIDCQDAFKCSLCKVIGPLYFIIKHIESFKHRRNYLSIAYKHMFPLYTKRMSYYERNWAVKKLALKVEQEERTLTVNASKSCNSRIGFKNDFLKYNIRRQEKLDQYAEKLSAFETQKKNILQYMETLVIASPEEAELVQNLTEELEAAVNVFVINTKPRYDWDTHEREQRRTGDCEGRYSRHTDFYHDKRSIWYGKDRKPSSSLCSDDAQSVSDKHSPTEKGRARKRSRSASKDMMLKVTFSTGSERGAENENSQEQQEQDSICPDKQFVVLSETLSESTEAKFHHPDANRDLFQEIRAKRIRKHSTDVAKWNSLFTTHRPEVDRSVLPWCPKSPSLKNTEVAPSEEKKENPRRASLDVLSSFTLFSQEGHERGPASGQPSSDPFTSFPSFHGPSFWSHKSNVFTDKVPQREIKIEWDRDEELPCSSNTVFNEARSADNVVMHIKQEPNDECTLNAEASCDQLSDVNANVAQAPKSSQDLDASSKFLDFKPCSNRHLDTKTANQDTLTSSKLHASKRQLSPEVLQLFKGKDTTSIVHILKTLSPFYPALKELDLEEFAKVLSKTGAASE